jgi:transcriptional regulator with XRE-family HTH domain
MPMNHRLRDRRLRRGWSLESAAERLNQLASATGERQVAVSASTFGKWERGVQQPRGVYRELLCLLYDASAEELGLYQPAAIEGTLEDMNRRIFLQGLGAVTGLVTSAALEPWQRLMAALRQPSRVDRQTVAELEHVTAELWSEPVDELLA